MSGIAVLHPYDRQLAQQVRDGEAGADHAAALLFERHDPRSLGQAIALVGADGPLRHELLERISRAYEIHRHVRELPSD